MFKWLKNRRRQQLLASPLPETWPAILATVPHYLLIPENSQAKLRNAVADLHR